MKKILAEIKIIWNSFIKLFKKKKMGEVQQKLEQISLSITNLAALAGFIEGLRVGIGNPPAANELNTIRDHQATLKNAIDVQLRELINLKFEI
jgi:hypothetical protein